MKGTVHSIMDEKLRTMELNDAVFKRSVSASTIYYAIRNELANMRVGTASTKQRSEVSASRRKPWRQKGTGRARAGGRSSPLWVGGGVVFGPKPRDYSYKMPRSQKRAAIMSILSLKVREDRLKIVEDFKLPSAKTKELAVMVSRLVPAERTVLILGDEAADRDIKRAARNIPWLAYLNYNRLRAHDLYYSRHLLLTESAATHLNSFFERNKSEIETNENDS